jgi:hypothetical protein
MNGDSSGWDTAMQMPHYSAAAMPAASLLEAHHVLQWIRSKRFAMYDYGDVRLNRHAYGLARADLLVLAWFAALPGCAAHASPTITATATTFTNLACAHVSTRQVFIAHKLNSVPASASAGLLKAPSTIHQCTTSLCVTQHPAPLQDKPPDISAEYHRLDIPVDIAAGTRDMIIEASSVFMHVYHMRAAGVCVSYRTFDFGHLDFTFSAQQDLAHFLLGCLEPWREKRGAKAECGDQQDGEAETEAQQAA